jgi:hypothetical protein
MIFFFFVRCDDVALLGDDAGNCPVNGEPE